MYASCVAEVPAWDSVSAMKFEYSSSRLLASQDWNTGVVIPTYGLASGFTICRQIW